MSQWTHVVGIIHLNGAGGKEFGKIFSERFRKNIPEGSEGKLHCRVIRGDATGRCGNDIFSYNWVVVIWGDLRDYGYKGDSDKIIQWIVDCTNFTELAAYVREGVIEINVEFAETVIMNFKKKSGEWGWIINKLEEDK